MKRLLVVLALFPAVLATAQTASSSYVQSTLIKNVGLYAAALSRDPALRKQIQFDTAAASKAVAQQPAKNAAAYVKVLESDATAIETGYECIVCTQRRPLVMLVRATLGNIADALLPDVNDREVSKSTAEAEHIRAHVHIRNVPLNWGQFKEQWNSIASSDPNLVSLEIP